jgi:hypothetical protein
MEANSPADTQGSARIDTLTLRNLGDSGKWDAFPKVIDTPLHDRWWLLLYDFSSSHPTYLVPTGLIVRILDGPRTENCYS